VLCSSISVSDALNEGSNGTHVNGRDPCGSHPCYGQRCYSLSLVRRGP